jgi:hypothetical protein
MSQVVMMCFGDYVPFFMTIPYVSWKTFVAVYCATLDPLISLHCLGRIKLRENYHHHIIVRMTGQHLWLTAAFRIGQIRSDWSLNLI